MARRGGFLGRIRSLFTRPVREVTREVRERARPEPPPRPAPERQPVSQQVRDDRSTPEADEFGGEPSGREYHVILEGYGPVWFRPIIGDERTTRDYVINMQGFLRGGTRNISLKQYQSKIRKLRGITVSGELSDGTVIDDVPFETTLSEIEEAGNAEDMLTGGGWKS